MPARTNSLAITSAISGILSYFVCPIVGAVVAVATGHVARGQIRRLNEGGWGWATAGLVLGYAHFAIWGVILVVLFSVCGGLAVLGTLGRATQSPTPAVASGVPCDQLEHSQAHFHAAIQIVYQGTLRPIPANIGIVTDSAGYPSCFYWLHVHAGSPDVIHVEAPANQSFTLGQFFDVWTAWNKSMGQPQHELLDATHVSTITLAGDQKLVVYIDLQDGKGPQVYTGDPKAIPLKSHEIITLEITPPTVSPPPSFTFSSGL